MGKLLTLLAFALVAVCPAQITIRMMAGPSQGIPPKEDTNPRSIARRAVFEEFHRLHPEIQVVNAGGLELTGDNAESGFLMSMAGDTAPDVFYVNFRQYYSYIDQGFCRPLDDLAATDAAALHRLNPTIENVLRSYDGKLYAVPWYQVAMALYYRKDHFIEAGLDPNKPPRTWEEFIAYGRKLTDSAPGRNGFAFSRGGGSQAYHWVNFLWQAGGEVVQPAENGYWRSAVATPQAAQALDFYRRMVNEKWTGADGKQHGPMASVSSSQSQDILTGKVSMWLAYTNDVILNQTDLNPSLVGAAALPAGPAGSRNEINAGMWAISSKVTDPAKLKACWEFIKFFASDQAAKVNTDRFVQQGLGNLVNPVWLKQFGYTDELATIDPLFVKANEEVFKSGHPEPYGRNCQQVYTVLDGALERASLEPNTPAIKILQDISLEMDRKLLGYTPPEILATRRAWAFGILLGAFAVLGWILVGKWRAGGFKVKELEQTTGLPAGVDVARMRRFLAFTLLPALLSILVWSYYPLSKGLLIAFQDYRVLKGPQWVGLDNFISVFTSQIFWRSLLNSLLYVSLSLTIGFFLPIFLALALNEIPRGKVFFRTLFYLPAMVSSVVVAYLWRQFYDKTETGILNSLLAFPTDLLNTVAGWLHLGHIEKAHDWLGNPSLAMFAVVLPGIWAGAGPGSILYLAALKNIPDERYEAADLDGANWVQKTRFIIFPGLRTLILINLVGVFIASFKTMDTVFVLTGGGPLYSTHTIGLEVWTNAFMFLRFGYATAAAWVMGSILIGFTLTQIRSLLRVKFRSASV